MVKEEKMGPVPEREARVRRQRRDKVGREKVMADTPEADREPEKAGSRIQITAVGNIRPNNI